MKINVKEIVQYIEEVGRDILRIKSQSYCVNLKDDGSECTDADIFVSNKISSYLGSKFPHIPIISEENTTAIKSDKFSKDLFWLLDPLDGTRAFINNKDYYSINLALVENDIPVIGIICFPEENLVYFSDGISVYKKNAEVQIKLENKPINLISMNVAISQRSDPNFISKILKKISVKKIDKIPGAKKFCLMAEGRYDIFPRSKNTFEWDVAAGHAIVLTMGGSMVTENLQELKYLKKEFKNTVLITVRDKKILELLC